ncbi:MAG TPA: cyanophycin synthetase [Thermoleophilaceae bacterium]|nr:cyanophycin synthetase [Thermoleophilaceae bacterium]
MTFRQAEEYLLGLELFGMRFGLDRMHKLMTVLGLPQRRFASIHVVGSNGKSSTVRFCAAILERHGVRTGSYTSPHLGSFRERIEVGEEPVSEVDFAAAVQRAAHAAELVNRTQAPDDGVTQFEALTAAAYHELARRGVEAAVVEAGLGGRFDATNVIPSKVQVLTSVGLEHTRWLGPTLTDIAGEKLAVVRDHATLVLGELGAEVRTVADRVAADRRARMVVVGPEPDAGRPVGAVRPTDLGIALRAPGRFQRRNFALAAAAAEAFLDRPLDRRALERAGAETRIPGRLDVVSGRPLTVYDSAHNPDGARALADSLDEVLGDRRPRVAVVAILEDKDAAGMLEALLPAADRAVFTRSSNPRSLPPATLATLAEKLGAGDAVAAAETVADPRAAVERARELAGPGGAVLATGSIYLVADLMRERPRARASTL